MALFWLAHKTSAALRLSSIAAHLMARVKASMAGQKGEFHSGIQFDDATAKQILAEWIGKTLSQTQAQCLLKESPDT